MGNNAAVSLATPANSSVTLVWPPSSTRSGSPAATPTQVLPWPIKSTSQSLTAPPLGFGSPAPADSWSPPGPHHRYQSFLPASSWISWSPVVQRLPQPQPRFHHVRSRAGCPTQFSHSTSTPPRPDAQPAVLPDGHDSQAPACSSPFPHATAQSVVRPSRHSASALLPTVRSVSRSEKDLCAPWTAPWDVTSRRAPGWVVSELSQAASSCAFASIDTLLAATPVTPRLKKTQELLDQMQDSPLRTPPAPAPAPAAPDPALPHLPSDVVARRSDEATCTVSDAGAVLRSTALKRRNPPATMLHSDHRSKRPKHRNLPSRAPNFQPRPPSQPEATTHRSEPVRRAQPGSLDRWMVPEIHRSLVRSRPTTKRNRTGRTTATYHKGETPLQPLQRSQHVPQVQQQRSLQPSSHPPPSVPSAIETDSENSRCVAPADGTEERHLTPDPQPTRYCPKIHHLHQRSSAEPRESLEEEAKKPKESNASKMATASSSDVDELEFDPGPHDTDTDKVECVVRWDNEAAYPSSDSTAGWSSTGRTICRAPRSNLRQAPSSPPSSPARCSTESDSAATSYAISSQTNDWDSRSKDHKERQDRDAAFALLGLGLRG